MSQIMLHPNHAGSFRRCVRKAPPKTGGTGEILKTLIFKPGEVMTLKGRELEAVGNDIAKGALVEVEKDDRDKWRPKASAKPETMEITLEEYERDISEAEARGSRSALTSPGNNGDGNGKHAA